MQFEFTQIADDKLSQKRWEFHLTEDARIVLDYYYEQSRPSTRHKFQTDQHYSRLFGRDCRLSINDVIVPSIVASNIISQINCKLQFCSDYQGTPIKIGK